MMLQKRIDYGFNGYQVPPTPRATRSARRRRTFRRKGDDNQMCSFDLLATVAGKLLLEGDSSNSSADTSSRVKDSIKKEHYTEPDPKSIGHGICDQSVFISELVFQAPVLNKCSKGPLVAQHNSCSGPASAITSSASCKLDGDDSKKEIKSETFNNGKVSFRNVTEHSVKFPLCGNHIPCGSISVNNEDVKLCIRDDDENSGCTQPSTGNKAFRPITCNGDRRIKKDDEECIANYVCNSMTTSFKRREMSVRDYPFKKRRLYYSSSSNPNDNINGEGKCSSPRKCSYSDILAPVGTSQGVTGPSGTSVERTSFQPRDSHVKLKIKSFRVPELFIEISETATVGSLKRTVMEAVTAILGGDGLHVGVLVQGKKIKDDNKTLLQTGISRYNNPDALGFVLEPSSSSQATPVLSSEALPFLLPCDTPEPLKRCPAGPSLVHDTVQHESSDVLPYPPVNNFNNFIESDHDSAPSPPDTSHEQNAVNSRALVVVPSMNPEALSVVPMRKPKKSESAQRRIRRPFSVSEVEALVQAVEKLGTGRWRDVKLRAFDTAKHRTYVDLKDKWKTLVHTARISPQQRRGEPVPQELLDRVMMAHAYWSQQQAKQQLKQHSEACLLL